MTTFKISSGVGLGQSNKSDDIAFIQMALKVIPKGKYNRTASKSYWPGRIDGKYSYKIGDAISSFKDQHFSEKELSELGLLLEGVEVIPSANSKAYKRLINLLPAKYKGVDYRFGKLPARTFVYQFKKGSSRARVAFTEQQLAIANADSKKLIQHLTTMIKGFHIIPTIEKSIVGNQGNYQFVIGLKGGQLIDDRTAEIYPTTTASAKKTILEFMRSGLNNPMFPPGSIWEATGTDRLIIKSKKKYPLIASPKTRTWFKLNLAHHKIPFQAAAVQKALDAFDFQRLTGGLTPEKEKFLIEFLGADWPKIQDAYGLRKIKGLEFRKNLADTIGRRDHIMRQLVTFENLLRDTLEMDPIDVLGEFQQDVAALLVNIAAGKVGGKLASKIDPKYAGKLFEVVGKKSNAAAEAAKLSASSKGQVLAVAIDKPQDSGDRFLLYAGLAVLAVVFVGLILVSGGAVVAGAALLTGAVYVKLALVVAESFKVGYNVGFNLLSNLGLEREAAFLQSNIKKLTDDLKNAISDFKTITTRLVTDQEFDVTELGFTKSELDAGQASAKEQFSAG